MTGASDGQASRRELVLTTPLQAYTRPLARSGFADLPVWARWRGDGHLTLRVLRTYTCCGCKTDTAALREDYMVYDHIWAAASMTTGFLCIGCLETRLGRQLVSADFTGAPINRDTHWNVAGYRHVPVRRSPRLQDRLNRGN